jgi:colicin import membrane protein
LAVESPSPSRIKHLAQTVVVPRWNWVRADENRFFGFMIAVSALAHLLVAVVDFGSFMRRTPIVEEWSMDVDLFADAMPGAPDKSALPDAEKAPEAKVSDRMLPQLPKQFAIKEAAPPEEKTFTERVDDKEAPAKDEAKETPKEEVTKAPPQPSPEEEKNRIDEAEARKRAVLEKLRREQKTAEKNKAEDASADAKLAELAAKARERNSGAVAGLTSRSSFRTYQGLLYGAVRRNFQLPEAYNYAGREISAIFAVRVSERGDLIDIKMDQSSGDEVFDNEAMRALRASVPLPPPPRDLVGETILVQFSPRSL